MALTQISTAGVKDDAVTAGKIPANAVGSSELADNAVDTAAIINNAVTNAKIADGQINSAKIVDGSIVNADINASAAIAGSKISPDFGSQNIATTGTLGVGTTSPQENLHILSSSGSARIRMTSADGSDNMIVFGDTSDQATGAIKFDHSDNSLALFGFDNAEKMRIDSSGKLLLGQNSDSDGQLCMNGVLAFSAGGNGTASTSNARPNISRGADGQLLLAAGKDSGSTIRFDVAANATTNAAEVLRITSSGILQYLRSTYQSGTVEQKINYHSKAGTSGSSVIGQNAEIAFVKKDSWDPTWTSYGEIVFRVNGDSRTALDEAARFNYSGNLAFPSGQGIDFSSTGDATGKTSELLDDYEEGTWTPTVGSGGTINSTVSARYTKIGRMVHYQFYINMGSSSSTSSFSIGGLPYTAGNASQYFYGTGRVQNATFVTLQIDANSNGGLIYTSGGSTLKFNTASNNYVLLSGVYEAT